MKNTTLYLKDHPKLKSKTLQDPVYMFGSNRKKCVKEIQGIIPEHMK